MATTWNKLEDGTWGIKIEDGDHPVHMVGQARVVTAKSGKKTRVVIGQHVRGWLGQRGRHIDIYKVEREIPL